MPMPVLTLQRAVEVTRILEPMSEQHHSAERLTDEDAAFLRHVRFGELPAHPAPEDLVAETEAETMPRRDAPPGLDNPWHNLRTAA